MKFIIKHELDNRIRVHIMQKKMSYEQADTLVYYFRKVDIVTNVKVYERTCDIVICFNGNKEDIKQMLVDFDYDKVEVPEAFLENTGRELNAKYYEKLVDKVIVRYVGKLLVPYPVRTCITAIKSAKYIYNGLKSIMKRKIEVPLLDGIAIGISVLRQDFSSADSVMFLLGIGELLEEWTHKKSIDDLARAMSLHVGKVWIKANGQELLVSADQVNVGDEIIARMGTVIPYDGEVTLGEAMINQASLTGESVAIRKAIDNYVYAGTYVEEGEITIKVKETSGSSRYEKIVSMIEETEKLKSATEGKSEHLADKLVPYTLSGALLTYLFTRNITKAISVLMVDFSCALKLAMPITVLSAIREAGTHDITVKGGKYLEAIAEADTIVFDKTGTLTKATPKVADVISFSNETPDELLRIAACMEEHFPHSMAKAVVNLAKEKDLKHEEIHSKVEYIVAHGISTYIEDKKAIIGSYHFVFEDEKCAIPEGEELKFANLPEQYTHLYLAIDGLLVAVICIEDPLRDEAEDVIKSLKASGIKKVVMLTGDNDKTARVIAMRLGVDEYCAEVLPDDKARYILKEKEAGRKVIMIGDGINDSPALSAADVGIAISDGAEIAREIADITIEADDLFDILLLRNISTNLMKRISSNYKFIIGFNSTLLTLGVFGIIQPTTSALLHNLSTLGVSLKGMESLVETK